MRLVLESLHVHALRITLRPAQASDADFAYAVLEQTMKAYALATWGKWLEAEARTSVAADAAAGLSQIIQLDLESIGIVRVDRQPTHHELEQLFILPEFQSQGIGSVVLSRTLAQAHALGLPVRLRVLRVNPAKAFYLRHGFRVISESPERFFMESAA